MSRLPNRVPLMSRMRVANYSYHWMPTIQGKPIFFLLGYILILIFNNIVTDARAGQDYSCPVRYLVMPCICNEITKGLEIVCEGVRVENLRGVFENVQQTGQPIVYLKMRNNYLQTFPSYLLSDINVRHLVAHKCNINHVELSAFAGLENKIESIDFSENKFTIIPSALKGLSSLVSLNLDSNQIESIDEKGFDGLVSLLRLSLFGNKITNIHPMAFVGIGLNLTRINLGGNQFTSIPSKALHNLKSIQRLEMHHNRISSLNRQDLDRLQALENLDALHLGHNLIERLEANIFVHLKSLTSIDFESNQISLIDDNAFNGIYEKLEWLKLSENQFKSIPSRALGNLTKLRELDMRGNQIKVLSKNAFFNFGRNIKFLFLQKNQIETIENGAFDHFESLKWIYLNSNKLKHIPEELFASLMDTLLILDLHDNPLICNCDLKWYQKWIEKNSKNQIAHIWKETKCVASSDQIQKDANNPNVNNANPNQLSISIYNLDANNIKCNAISRLFRLQSTDATNPLPYLCLAIGIAVIFLIR